MSTSNLFGMTFFKSGTATTTETTAANAVWDANGSRPRKVALANDDGAINLLYRVNIGSTQHTLLPNEAVLIDTISNGLQVEADSATVAFRATAEG